MNNGMLDIETLGKGSNSAIISIGAVFFEPSTGKLGGDFYQTITLESALENGQADASTIAWWMKQSDDARAVFNDKQSLNLRSVLLEFTDWLINSGNPISHNTAKVSVWGNGATFDNVILSNAYQQIEYPHPWPYWGDRDVRTIVELGRSILNINPKKDLPFEGTAHNALDDAKHQARYESEIYQALGQASKEEE